jgi:hypothetical protein
MRAEETPEVVGPAGQTRRTGPRRFPGVKPRRRPGGAIRRSSRFGVPADKLPAAEEEERNHVRDDLESTQTTL